MICCCNNQNIVHLLYECNVTQKLSDYLKMEYLAPDSTLSAVKVMSNTVNKTKQHIDNYIILVLKQYLFQEKCLGNIPSSIKLRRRIEFIAKIESDITMNVDKTRKRWSSVIQKM